MLNHKTSMTKPIKQAPLPQNPKLTDSQKILPPHIPRRRKNKETYPFGHGEFHTLKISSQNLTKHNTTSFRTHVSNLDFRFLHRLYHESIILGQVEDASTFPRRRKLPKSIIPTYSQHVISRIDLKQLSQMPTKSKPKLSQLKTETPQNTQHTPHPPKILHT